MNLLQDILVYMRRILKTPSSSVITDAILIDYVNRFWIMDVDARMQLFDLKTKYQFQTTPGVDQYNMPLYSPQIVPGSTPAQDQLIAMYPVYQGFLDPCYINGVRVPLETQKTGFFNLFPTIVQNLQGVVIGNGGSTYSFTIPLTPGPSTLPQNPPFQGLLRGHVDMAGIISTGNNVDPPLISNARILNIATDLFIQNMKTTSVYPAVWITSIGADGNNVIVTDSGQFLDSNANYGLLIEPGKAPFGNLPLGGVAPVYSTISNTVNYFTGQVNVQFPVSIPVGNNINVQCFFISTGLPRAMLFNNNILTLRVPPDRQYLVELDAYLTPSAFFNTEEAIPYAYMAEYLARGAARKILSDTGDWEQFNAYEPLFLEQESLVHIRSQRQWTNNRTQTIYSQGFSQGFGSNFGGTIL